jgi:hypothetical protein
LLKDFSGLSLTAGVQSPPLPAKEPQAALSEALNHCHNAQALATVRRSGAGADGLALDTRAENVPKP